MLQEDIPVVVRHHLNAQPNPATLLHNYQKFQVSFTQYYLAYNPENRKLKRNLILSIFIIVTVAVQAQDLSLIDLDSAIYVDLQRWEMAGYIGSLPQLQPYSHMAIINRLHRMLSNENLPGDIEKRAQDYLSFLNNRDPKIHIATSPVFRITEGGTHFNFTSSAGFKWLLSENNSSGTWTELKHHISLFDSETSTALPPGKRETNDWIPDQSSFEIFNRNIQLLQFPSSIVSFSSESPDGAGIFSFSAGNHRS